MSQDMNENQFQTKVRMNQYGIRPVKSLGQNFLNDEGVVQEIVFSADLNREDLVIEIGPGLGIMTRHLAAAAGRVAAAEIDARLIPPLNLLKEEYQNLEIIQGDILKLDITEQLIRPFLKPPLRAVKVVANLPYYITTPIIMRFLESGFPQLRSMTFLVQKEVGERMTAGPGGKEYGALSVSVGYFAEGRICFQVPPHCFIPQPNVDSCVIRLDIRQTPPFPLMDQAYFFKVVRASFCQRRKMLINSLANAAYLHVTRELVAEVLRKMGKDEKIRGEALTPAEFGLLANLLYQSGHTRN